MRLAAAKNRAMFEFKPFSRKQLKVLTWWTKDSPFRDYHGIIADGAVRSGKTLSMSLSFAMWAMQAFHRQSLALCGKTIGALRRNVILTLIAMLRSRGYQVTEKLGENRLTVTFRGRVNDFYLFSGRDERSYETIQGMTLAGCFFDEVVLMPQSFVNQALARCSVEGAKIWFNCNPGPRLHYFKTDFIDKAQSRRLVYLHFTQDDNLSLSENKKAQYRSDYYGVFYQRYILGLWVPAQGLIYDNWDDARNTYEAGQDPTGHVPLSGCETLIAIDYGTANPLAMLRILDDGYTLWVDDEYYFNSRTAQHQKTDAQYADDFEAFAGYDQQLNVIVDPSAASFITELRSRGYLVIKASNGVLSGIRAVSTAIGKGLIRVNRSQCPNLMREREGYTWDETARLHGREEPVKQNDHALDALRYAVVNRLPPVRLQCAMPPQPNGEEQQ